MAAELVGGALLSSLFQTLFNKLDSRDLRGFFRGLKVNQGLLQKLKTLMWSANQVLVDAEEKQLTNPDVSEWLFELKETIYEAEDVLDEINYRTLEYEQKKAKPRSKSVRKKLQSFLACFDTFDEAIERKIEEILDRLKHIVKQKDALGLKEGVINRRSQRLPAPLADESRVYGRNDDKEKIMKLLLPDSGSSSENKISVIPVVGMGGIGKTTLAQLVYEDISVKNHFDIRSWVTVSDESEISVIAKKILQEITSRKRETEGLYQLQCELKESLSGKRFLFVLDDVWTENYEHWEALLSSFQSGANGSGIIVTTRSDIVTKRMGNVPTHHLGEVSDDDCWKLFEEHVFINGARSEAYQELHAIGRNIVKKCKGVPLAVKSLAGLLRSVVDPEEWREILNSDIWELQLQENQSNNILPSLWLSYHYLPSHLKKCFAYCSIFPKDYEMHEFRKDEIIRLWMAEGLLQSGKRGKRIEDVGNEYFQDLISRSLFHPLSKDKLTILMHDLTHDLAIFVSGEFSCRLDDGDKAKFSAKTRHVSCSKMKDLESFVGLSLAKSLRTCVRSGSPYQLACSISMPQLERLLSIGGCLRALCLSLSGIRILPDSIGNLKHLRYLDLSRNYMTEEIPNTLCRLYYLQTLRLSQCIRLTQLPNDMGNLVNLRHLEIEGVPLEEMPPMMRNMKDLQTLRYFVLCKRRGSSIKELGGLPYLSGELEIRKLENVEVVEDVLEANLKDKRYLNKLVYLWSSNDAANESTRHGEVLDALQPHTNVKELRIEGYGGETFSNWLPSLQSLEIYNCRGVERIGAEFYGESSSNTKPFRSLRSLKFKDMPAWQEWSIPEGREDGGCFPSLEHLRIIKCPKLSGCLPDYLPSLEEVDVRDCPEFLLCNFPSNLKAFGINSYEDVMKFPSLEISGRYENVMKFPETLLPTTLTSLYIENLENLQVLNGEGFEHLACLEELIIQNCKELQCFPGEMLPTSLTTLHLDELNKLEDLGKGLQHLTSLKELSIWNCENLRCLSGTGLPASLTSLRIRDLPSLEDVGDGFLRHLISLETLEIRGCNNLQYKAVEENGKGVLEQLISLKTLVLSNCEKLQSLLEEQLPTSLTSLEIRGFPRLRDLNRMGFQHLCSLQHLLIGNCKNLKCLPDEGLLSSLDSLRISRCPLVGRIDHWSWRQRRLG
ncbi:putative disease resistance RPP13-like protein 1 isoform X2 [Morus notabilis]|uniref:putative disease resistance RPP13-like protein 1 isoform X2 n=1 Tax=Morus notabilis TaxID=981085 RepID=UPI000CECF764|nr:putative disease resistance RPP13-like protein 1 isoform X2 [Morus notabilis]